MCSDFNTDFFSCISNKLVVAWVDGSSQVPVDCWFKLGTKALETWFVVPCWQFKVGVKFGHLSQCKVWSFKPSVKFGHSSQCQVWSFKPVGWSYLFYRLGFNFLRTALINGCKPIKLKAMVCGRHKQNSEQEKKQIGF